MVLYYHAVGLLSEDGLRPFDEAHNGSLMGEGAAALVLETEDAARARGAPVLGEVLGIGHGGDALGLLPIRDDGAGLARAIRDALADARLQPGDVGMVVAHGNGTPNSDVSEARALRAVFGDRAPPVTAFKWSIGHLLAASGIIEAVLAIEALRARSVPGIANLQSIDPLCAGLPVAATAQAPRSDVVLLLARGFGGTSAALLRRAAGAGSDGPGRRRQPLQIGRVHQERVVALGRRERVEPHIDSHLAQVLGDELLLVDRVEHVGLRAEHEPALHAAQLREGCVERAIAVFGEVELVHRARQVQVTVGVVDFGETLALVFEVRLDLELRAEIARLSRRLRHAAAAKALVPFLVRAVGDRAELARHAHALARAATRLVIAAAPRRIVADDLALQRAQRDGEWVGTGRA